MAYQLDFDEERKLREECGRRFHVNRGAAAELRRAYDALLELSVGANSSTSQPLQEYQQMYLRAFESFGRGDTQNAEWLARAAKHLCRAAWFDAKIKHVIEKGDDFPHLPGLSDGGLHGIQQGAAEVENRLSRLKLTGLADRFGNRARNHLRCITELADRNSLVADTFMKAAYEYCLATEVLHEMEQKSSAA